MTGSSCLSNVHLTTIFQKTCFIETLLLHYVIASKCKKKSQKYRAWWHRMSRSTNAHPTTNKSHCMERSLKCDHSTIAVVVLHSLYRTCISWEHTDSICKEVQSFTFSLFQTLRLWRAASTQKSKRWYPHCFWRNIFRCKIFRFQEKNPFQIWAEPSWSANLPPIITLPPRLPLPPTTTKKGLFVQKQAQGLFSEFLKHVFP